MLALAVIAGFVLLIALALVFAALMYRRGQGDGLRTARDAYTPQIEALQADLTRARAYAKPVTVEERRRIFALEAELARERHNRLALRHWYLLNPDRTTPTEPSAS